MYDKRPQKFANSISLRSFYRKIGNIIIRCKLKTTQNKINRPLLNLIIHSRLHNNANTDFTLFYEVYAKENHLHLIPTGKI